MPAEETVKRLTMVAFMVAATSAAIANDAELCVSGYGSFDVSSAYVLYGARMNKEPCYWTYGELNLSAGEWGSIGASLWQNTDMTCHRKDTMRRMNEWDWASYLRSGYDIAENWRVAFEAGHIWYKYHGLKDSAKSIYKTMMEIYGRVELQNPYATPHLFAAYDWRITDGTFVVAGLKRDMELPMDITFTPDLTVGGGDDRYLACMYPPWDEKAVKGGISYVQLSGKLSYWLNDHFGIHAQVAYAVTANDRIRSGIDADASDYRKQFVWGTVGVDVAF